MRQNHRQRRQMIAVALIGVIRARRIIGFYLMGGEYIGQLGDE
jgi:hypothetical protein